MPLRLEYCASSRLKDCGWPRVHISYNQARMCEAPADGISLSPLQVRAGVLQLSRSLHSRRAPEKRQ